MKKTLLASEQSTSLQVYKCFKAPTRGNMLICCLGLELKGSTPLSDSWEAASCCQLSTKTKETATKSKQKPYIYLCLQLSGQHGGETAPLFLHFKGPILYLFSDFYFSSQIPAEQPHTSNHSGKCILQTHTYPPTHCYIRLTACTYITKYQ